ERERDVLDRVVLVDVEVAAALDLEREAAVLADLLKHVIEEPDARAHGGLGIAIEIDLDANIRLARSALDDRGARTIEQHARDGLPGLVGRAVFLDDESRDADVLRELEVFRAAADDGRAVAIEHAGREELADEPDARLAAAAVLLGRVRADQRRDERNALRREQRAQISVRALEFRAPEALAAEPGLIRHDDDLVAGARESRERGDHARHQHDLLRRVHAPVGRFLDQRAFSADEKDLTHHGLSVRATASRSRSLSSGRPTVIRTQSATAGSANVLTRIPARCAAPRKLALS